MFEFTPIQAELVKANQSCAEVAAALVGEGTMNMITDHELALLGTMREDNDLYVDSVIQIANWDADDRFNDFYYQHGGFDQ